MGHIAKILTVKRAKKLIDAYIETDCVKSIAGLALYLGVDRAELAGWQNDGAKGFSALISYAKTCIEKDIVENGLKGKYNATMSSFILKSSFGYRDKGEDAPQGPIRIEVADELREYAK